MTVIKAETASYLDAFRERPRRGPGWLTARRQTALTRFAEQGFPTRRQEAWRYTDLRALQRQPFPPGGPGKGEAKALAPYHLGEPGHRLVLVNGRLSPELSSIGPLAPGVWLGAMSRAIEEQPGFLDAAMEIGDTEGAQPFQSLNAAMFDDGFVLSLAPGATLDRPVEIIYWTEGEGPHSFHVRNLVALGEGASAAIVESFAGSGRYWTNAVNVTRAGRASRLTHVKVQDEGSEAVHFALHRVFLEERAQYQSFALTLGARLSRHESLVTIAGEGAECRLDGAYLLRGEQEATNATFVDHAAPGGVTTELFKGVVDDRAHGVFLGAITVRPEAQKTDARQMSRALILSPRAVVDTKPELDISADDVKCSHGATVGDLDQAALFYLASRGIPVGLARRMLIEAFANDAMAGVGEEALKALLHRHVQVWLERSGK